MDVVLVPFELRPNMPREGLSAKRSGLGHPEKVDEHMLRIARTEGFPMSLPDHIPHTHAAIVMGEVARDVGAETHWRTHEAIFRAYYGEGRDIGAQDVLLDVAESIGLDTVAVAAAWLEDTYEERLHAFRHFAMHVGIDATPAAMICNELLIGSRPYAVMRDTLDRCLVTKENAERAATETEGSEAVGAFSASGDEDTGILADESAVEQD